MRFVERVNGTLLAECPLCYEAIELKISRKNGRSRFAFCRNCRCQVLVHGDEGLQRIQDNLVRERAENAEA